MNYIYAYMLWPSLDYGFWIMGIHHYLVWCFMDELHYSWITNEMMMNVRDSFIPSFIHDLPPYPSSNWTLPNEYETMYNMTSVEW